MSFNIAIHVFVKYSEFIREELLHSIANHSLNIALAKESSTVNIVIGDDELVRDLNKTHRGVDEKTDVLAFSFDHDGQYYGDANHRPETLDNHMFVLPPNEKPMLGEVIISYPQVEKQARSTDRKVTEELSHVLVHGILHLLGHDHVEPTERDIMQKLENNVMEHISRTAV